MDISILVVDDDEVHLKGVSRQLSYLGYSVYCARSGSEAVEWLKSHKVGLVITDYQMGNMSGAQLRDLIVNENPKRLPIILMTGRRDRNLPMGFDGFLQKPFTMSELHKEVERVLLTLGG